MAPPTGIHCLREVIPERRSCLRNDLLYRSEVASYFLVAPIGLFVLNGLQRLGTLLHHAQHVVEYRGHLGMHVREQRVPVRRRRSQFLVPRRQMLGETFLQTGELRVGVLLQTSKLIHPLDRGLFDKNLGQLEERVPVLVVLQEDVHPLLLAFPERLLQDLNRVRSHLGVLREQRVRIRRRQQRRFLIAAGRSRRDERGGRPRRSWGWP